MAKREQRRLRQLAARKERIRKQKARQNTRVSTAGSATMTVTPDTIGQAMTVATGLHHANKFGAAEDIYRQVLAIQPEHLDALSGLAMIEYQAQRYAQGIKLLQQSEHPYEPASAEKPFRLLVFGGSQGARYFSEMMPQFIKELPLAVRRWLRTHSMLA